MGASTSSSSNQPSEQYGLFEFEKDPLLKSDPDEVPYNVDIVAIHGITGDAYETWKHQNGKLWLQDFVLPALPGARVFTFGYPASVFESMDTGDLASYALQLLNGVHSSRTGEQVIGIEPAG